MIFQGSFRGSVGSGGPLRDHDHSGEGGSGGQFDIANLSSGEAALGQVPTADGEGGATWEDAAGGGASQSVSVVAAASESGYRILTCTFTPATLTLFNALMIASDYSVTPNVYFDHPDNADDRYVATLGGQLYNGDTLNNGNWSLYQTTDAGVCRVKLQNDSGVGVTQMVTIIGFGGAFHRDTYTIDA